MKGHVACGFVSICFLVVFSPVLMGSQQPQESAEPPTFRAHSSLVLVDVISRDRKTGLPIRDFTKEDFRLFDNRHQVPIATFDAGAREDTRPVTLWLVVICNEGGLSQFWASAEFSGQESLFRPALKLVRLIIGDAYRRNPRPLPVIVFLHGDHTRQPHLELNQLVDDFLETSGIVFGIQDYRAPKLHLIGEQSKIMHYMATHTGGEYFSSSPSGFAAALVTILAQLHFRYELGFIPPAIDGKRHELKVELTNTAQKKHKGVRLRFRPEYIPVSEQPEWVR